jgi:hypothetical protein
MYARLKQCFSQEKDELVLGFERQTENIALWQVVSLKPSFENMANFLGIFLLFFVIL